MPESVSHDEGEGQPTTGFGGTIFLQQAAHVTILDGRGRIITVNDAWIRFGRENGLDNGYQFVGVSYPEVCERAIGSAHDAEGAREALGGVTSVLAARETRFSLVYPCHAPQKQRWFLMYARPIGGRADGAVVSHIDVTSLHLAGLVPDETARRAGATASSKAIVDKLAQMLFRDRRRCRRRRNHQRRANRAYDNHCVDDATSTNLFDHHAAFDPAGDFEAFLKQVPAKWAVYLMADADHRPVQLLCVKNLRYSLKRRLGGGGGAGAAASGAIEEPIGLSKRVDYRELIRHVYWRRVDSAFEADIVYLDAARHTFPQTYRGMTGFRPAWFVHVNPHTTYPRYTRTIEPTHKTGVYLGPLEDKHAAQKLVHLAEALFDLCRDYSILAQSPHAGPCAWKQMGKCVGPCDGTISLEAYRELVAHSAAVLSDPQDHIREQTRRMHQAAAELRFETAERIKAYVEQLSQLGKGPFRHVRLLTEFTWLSLQRGPREGTAKAFLVTPGRVEEIAGLISEPTKASDLLRLLLESAAARPPQIDQNGIEAMGVVAHHLFQAKAVHGVFLPLANVDEKSLGKAFRDLQKQKVPEPTEGEGVVKELQAM